MEVSAFLFRNVNALRFDVEQCASTDAQPIRELLLCDDGTHRIAFRPESNCFQALTLRF
jgi:hypothetical protein